MIPAISIVICSHNPRPEYLCRVIGALRIQTLPLVQWELLLIDNASQTKLADVYDLSWHPHARHLHEEELGKTPALLRGIRESASDLLIVVDDDNVLESDYLEKALDISHRYPYLGAWSGSLIPEFETPPPSWTKPYQISLAIRTVVSETWANAPLNQNPALPYGAGMCVRRAVANAYASACLDDPRRRGLDRKGTNTISAGDTDLSLFSCDMGLGTGLFPRLRLIHLMPTRRLELEYLLRMIEGADYSLTILAYIRYGIIPTRSRPFSLQALMQWLRRRRLSSPDRLLKVASERGKKSALRQIIEWEIEGK